MAKATLEVSARLTGDSAGSVGSGTREVTIRLHNPTAQLGFFERAEVLSTPDGDEILPIEYDDNYITVFPESLPRFMRRYPPARRTPAGSASPDTEQQQPSSP